MMCPNLKTYNLHSFSFMCRGSFVKRKKESGFRKADSLDRKSSLLSGRKSNNGDIFKR